MSYTAPNYDAIDFNGVESGYVTPNFDAVDFAPGAVALQPAMGIIALDGLQANLTISFNKQATSLLINITGHAPSGSMYVPFYGAASMAGIDINGGIPSVVFGFNRQSQIGGVVLSGQQASLKLLHAKQSNFTLSGYAPALKNGFITIASLKELALSSADCTFKNRVLVDIPDNPSKQYYRCTLTGASDSLPDVALNASSLRIRSTKTPHKHYYNVVISNAELLIDAINARPNGLLVIDAVYDYVGSDSVAINIVKTQLDMQQISRTAANTILTLSGYATIYNLDSYSVQLSGPVAKTYQNALIGYQCNPDPRVRPNDTVTINGESIVANVVEYIANAKTNTMHVYEG